jgi:pimeloyl-ACP methyl ester carboxylesterase
LFLDSGDALLNVVEWGPAGAPPFVAHGGWAGNWELWQEPFQLMQSRWRCIAYDHRGSGSTVASPDRISPRALVDDLLRLLDQLSVERCVLAGESMGALTVLTLAAEHPERLAGLVLVAGKPVGGVAEEFVANTRGDYAATVRWFVDACVPEPDSDHIKRWGSQILLRSDGESAARLLETAVSERPPAERVQAPTLIVHGDRDVIVPLDDARELHRRMPESQLVILPGAGHVPTLTRPREVVDAVDAWWNGRPV